MKWFPSYGVAIGWLLFFAAGLDLSAGETQESQPPPPATNIIGFDRDVRPILESNCLRCHGPEKPRSHFQLINREAALLGGDENTNDIVPGDGSRSMLIKYVSRQVPDLEMPPVGKGDPLTSRQVAVLRAWIDQGLDWSTTNQPPQTTLTFSPTLRWIGVQGSESKFRELQGVNPGFSGGVESFSFIDQLSPDEKISVSGHVIAPNQDIAVKLALEKTGLGFIHAGFDEWRKYYNDVGGYDPVVTPPEFSLNRKLYVDNGRAWVDFGLMLPREPQMILGYEYQFQNGTKSMLNWGWVSYVPKDPNSVPFKAIYPATQAVDEHTHIIKLDLAYDFNDWHLANSGRVEFYSENNLGVEPQIFSGGTTPDSFVKTRDNYQSTQGMNTLMLEKQIRDWWFVSGGFYYSKLEGSDLFNQTNGIFSSSLSSQQITLDRQSEIFSVASLFRPLAYLTFSLGTQNEWTSQNGFGNSVPDLDTGTLALVGSNAELFKSSQNANLRFTKIPFMVLYADGRFDQESVNQFQQQDPGGGFNTETRTDANNYRYDFSSGFNVSPWRWCALNAQYQYRSSDTDYNYPVNVVGGIPGPGNGYPGFILNRKIKTDAFESKLELRPANWVKTTLSFKIAGTDYSSVTDPAFFPPGSAQLVSPGGSIMDGSMDTQTYGLSVTLTPIQRLYCSSAFTYTHSRAATASNGDPSIVPYSGDIYTISTTATYALNLKTSVQASYLFSYADYGQNNAAAGLPLGINFTRDEVLIGLTRQLTTRLSCALHYQFSEYNEPSSGSANNFTAQGVFATLVYKWQ